MTLKSHSAVNRSTVENAIREGHKIDRIIHYVGTAGEYCESLDHFRKRWAGHDAREAMELSELEARQNYMAMTQQGINFVQ